MGIGEWNQKQLNTININSFRQIAKMTPDVLEEAKGAIKHFRGRIESEHWVFQAQKIVDGKWEQLVPDTKRIANSNGIKCKSEKVFEKELIDIANHYPGGHIDASGAEALWWSALDGGRVTDRERETLQYIMISTKYKMDDATKMYLKNKLKKDRA